MTHHCTRRIWKIESLVPTITSSSNHYAPLQFAPSATRSPAMSYSIISSAITTYRTHALQEKARIKLRIIFYYVTRKLKMTYPTTSTASSHIPNMRHSDSCTTQFPSAQSHTSSCKQPLHVHVEIYKIKLKCIWNLLPQRETKTKNDISYT